MTVWTNFHRKYELRYYVLPFNGRRRLPTSLSHVIVNSKRRGNAVVRVSAFRETIDKYVEVSMPLNEVCSESILFFNRFQQSSDMWHIVLSVRICDLVLHCLFTTQNGFLFISIKLAFCICLCRGTSGIIWFPVFFFVFFVAHKWYADYLLKGKGNLRVKKKIKARVESKTTSMRNMGLHFMVRLFIANAYFMTACFVYICQGLVILPFHETCQ